MSHKSTPTTTTHFYGLLSVLSIALGVIINYSLRPELLNGATAYSVMGTLPETKFIFTASLLIAAILFFFESHYTFNKWQRYGCYLISLGLVLVGLIPISHGSVTDLIHGIGAMLTMTGLLLNIVNGINARWPHLGNAKKVFYILLLGIALSSAVTFILSTGTFPVWALSGYAELSGLTVFAAWVLIDFGDKFTAQTIK